jgi:regulator of cell morphogenesis and NO signaling
MVALDHTTALGDVVLHQPEAARLFEQLGLDYCCGGGQPLGQACARQGVDAGTVLVLLRGLRRSATEPPVAGHDVAHASIAELCDHIVAQHHDPLREDLPRIAELLATVVRVHGAGHPELAELERLFAATRAELEEHLSLEEQTLFPACRALEDADGAAAVDPRDLEHLRDDHRATADALHGLRELAGGYDPERALCGTHRALLGSLNALEVDLHQHVHEENNVLFGRVRDRLAAAG